MCIVLFAMKLDGYLDADWMLLFSPVWIVFLVMGIFTIFMFPGMNNPKIAMHRFAILLITHNIFLLAFFIALLTKLIYTSTTWYAIFIPLWFALLTQAISMFWSNPSSRLSESMFLLAVTTTTILIPVKLEEDPYPWAVAMTPLWCLVAYWCFRMLYHGVKKKEQTPLLGNK